MTHHLPAALFERVVIPVASEADARMASETILPYLEQVGGAAIVVHVIKYAEDGVFPSPPSMQEADADAMFDIVRENTDVVVQTRKAYGTDVAAAILDVAKEVNASSVVISPRPKNRVIRLLSGDTALSLVTNPEIPVLSIPRQSE